MENKKFTLEDLKSGYVVVTRNGARWMVMRVGRFTKALISDVGWWDYLSRWDQHLKRKVVFVGDENDVPVSNPDLDIMQVYGLVNDTGFYTGAITCNTDHRDLLWERKNLAVKMTVAEICEKLGYDVEIVKEK